MDDNVFDGLLLPAVSVQTAGNICAVYGNVATGEGNVRKLPTRFRNCKFELKIDNVPAGM